MNRVSFSSIKIYDRGYRWRYPELVHNHILDYGSEMNKFIDCEHYDPLSPGYTEPRKVTRLLFPRERGCENIIFSRSSTATKILSYHETFLVGLKDPWKYDPKDDDLVKEWNNIFEGTGSSNSGLYFRTAKKKESGNWDRLIPTVDIAERRIDLYWRDHKDLPVKSVLSRVLTRKIRDPSVIIAESAELRRNRESRGCDHGSYISPHGARNKCVSEPG